ncbi:hypothetical protein XELAEV_18033692mg [Xenopus laevis]|uniref:Uncharacterized protein n=1 Tax=Xenopus laevis TaxID=8355 RepID=A0A974HE76_XENLA|nr:hypothetical protein XELAEV_18033692mg [Xenopus laevis]
MKVNCPLEYSAEFDDICKVIRKHIPILFNDPILKDVSLKLVSRRSPTLGRTLSPSLVSSSPVVSSRSWLSTKGTFKCGRYPCKTYKTITVSSEFTSNPTEKLFKNHSYNNCCSKNVVYLLESNMWVVQLVPLRTESGNTLTL